MGEVSGNWAPPPSTSTAQAQSLSKEEQTDTNQLSEQQSNQQSDQQLNQKTSVGEGNDQSQNASQATINVSLPANSTAGKGQTVLIPITVGDTTGQNIFGFDFTVSFDPNVLQPATVAFDTAGTLSGAAGFTITPNTTTSGQVTISGFGTQQPLSGSGTLLFLRFTVVGMAETPTDRTNLTFTSFMFNEGDPAAATTNGSFIVATPTAANVSIGGRVLTATGRGIRNVRVTLTDSSGATRTTLTNPFGFYRFDDVAAGETYIISVSHKRYRFNQSTRVQTIVEELNELDFVADN
jgi:hypothetical protein